MDFTRGMKGLGMEQIELRVNNVKIQVFVSRFTVLVL